MKPSKRIWLSLLLAKRELEDDEYVQALLIIDRGLYRSVRELFRDMAKRGPNARYAFAAIGVWGMALGMTGLVGGLFGILGATIAGDFNLQSVAARFIVGTIATGGVLSLMGAVCLTANLLIWTDPPV